MVHSERNGTEGFANGRSFTLEPGWPAGIIGLDRDGHWPSLAPCSADCRLRRAGPKAALSPRRSGGGDTRADPQRFLELTPRCSAAGAVVAPACDSATRAYGRASTSTTPSVPAGSSFQRPASPPRMRPRKRGRNRRSGWTHGPVDPPRSEIPSRSEILFRRPERSSGQRPSRRGQTWKSEVEIRP